MTEHFVRPDTAAFLQFLNAQTGPKMHEIPVADARNMMLAMRHVADAEVGEIAVTRDIAIPGPAGGATTVMVGATPISGHTAVALDSGGLLIYADCTNPAHIGAVQGVVGNAYSPGDLVVVQTDFELVHAGWSFSPGPVFVGASGALVQTLPPGALFAQVVGFALAPTRIRVDVQPPIVLT